ncbi:fibronectin type III domain protein, partial [Candidatus Symbiothrix dinenymphae]
MWWFLLRCSIPFSTQDPSSSALANYSFAGWFYDDDDDEPSNDVRATFPISVLEPVHLHATWELKRYEIAYELDGGHFRNPGIGGLYGDPGVVDSITRYTILSTFTLPEPVKQGWVFDGWFENAAKTLRNSRIEAGSSGNKKFYAKWRLRTITYMMDGGHFKNPGIGGAYGAPGVFDSITAYSYFTETPLVAPERTEWFFDGWRDREPTEVDPGIIVRSIPAGQERDIVLWARWLFGHTVTFNTLAATASPVPPQIVGHTRTFAKPEPPTLTGYVFFNKWYVDSLCTIEWDFEVNRVLCDTVLYGKWGKTNFEETFEPNSPTFEKWKYTQDSQPNKWFIGTGARNSNYAAYISDDGGVSNHYAIDVSTALALQPPFAQATSISHLYIDLELPSAAEDYVLTYDWKAAGEGGVSEKKDYMTVYMTDTTVIPVAGQLLDVVAMDTCQGDTAWRQAKHTVEARFNGTTRRLIFSWINDDKVGSQTPAAIDHVVVSTPVFYSLFFDLSGGHNWRDTIRHAP